MEYPTYMLHGMILISSMVFALPFLQLMQVTGVNKVHGLFGIATFAVLNFAITFWWLPSRGFDLQQITLTNLTVSLIVWFLYVFWYFMPKNKEN